jgi:hypothetical protein
MLPKTVLAKGGPMKKLIKKLLDYFRRFRWRKEHNKKIKISISEALRK